MLLLFLLSKNNNYQEDFKRKKEAIKVQQVFDLRKYQENSSMLLKSSSRV